MNSFYRPSGKFSPLSFVLFIIASLTLLPFLGIAYAYALWNSHFGVAGLLIFLIFLLAISFSIATFIIGWGKVRSERLAIFFGVLGAVVFLYCHWAAWIALSSKTGMLQLGGLKIAVHQFDFSQMIHLLSHPDELFNSMREINSQGTWNWITRASKMDMGKVSGLFLTIIWIFEAMLMILFSKGVSVAFAKMPFSEMDQKWHKHKTITVERIKNTTAFVASLKEEEYKVLKELKKTDDKANNHTILELFYADHGDFYLSGQDKLVRSKKGERVNSEERYFMKYLRINQDVGRELLRKMDL